MKHCRIKFVLLTSSELNSTVVGRSIIGYDRKQVINPNINLPSLLLSSVYHQWITINTQATCHSDLKNMQIPWKKKGVEESHKIEYVEVLPQFIRHSEFLLLASVTTSSHQDVSPIPITKSIFFPLPVRKLERFKPLARTQSECFDIRNRLIKFRYNLTTQDEQIERFHRNIRVKWMLNTFSHFRCCVSNIDRVSTIREG